ncbi:hypothetical protein [Sinimarinibacterium thermocellulolyticum]|uniref:Uncharacterized protein n=1 Tax=Sinimarinibacterium thermocellulolyticum TaxID=3170016 RepID=A0ABV2A9B7_9GAMM
MATQGFESQLKAFRKKLDSVAASRKKQIAALRAKAAEAALNWVMSHEDRVNQFKRAVKGTPVAGAVDKLLDLLKSEAQPNKPAKKAAKKAPAKKATKRAAKKAPSKTAPTS